MRSKNITLAKRPSEIEAGKESESATLEVISMKISYIVMFVMATCTILLACTPNNSESKQKNPAKEQEVDGLGLSELEQQLDEWESTKRVIWQKPEMVISLIENIEQKTVADLGAGSGYFAFRLAGRAKKVIALDIDPQMIAFMDSVKYHQLTESRFDRFEARLCAKDDARLKIAEVDAVLLTNTYLYIQDRVTYFSNLQKSLTPKGRIVIVDWKPGNFPVGPEEGIKLSTFDVTQELQQAGYKIINVDETSLKYQYIIIAESQY